jgi:hypothetical protein
LGTASLAAFSIDLGAITGHVIAHPIGIVGVQGDVVELPLAPIGLIEDLRVLVVIGLT